MQISLKVIRETDKRRIYVNTQLKLKRTGTHTQKEKGRRTPHQKQSK